MTTKIEGLAEVLTNLHEAIEKIEGATEEGMREVGLFLQGEAMEITPQRTGFLLGTAFSATEVVLTHLTVTRIGYTARYAPFVHEMPATFNYTKPGTGPKFLERTVQNHIPEILAILRDSVKIP